jgi:glucans biosynthesis protein
MDRRQFLLGGLATGALSSIRAVRSAERAPQKMPLILGPEQPFSFELLIQRATELSRRPYIAPVPQVPDIVHSINFDATQSITFLPQYSLWPAGPGPYPVRFFHLNRYTDVPVRIHELTGGTSREILYAPQYFQYADAALAQKLPANLGFAGFRVMNGRHSDIDWLAFQGASYFRSAGIQDQYGLSARGIAVNTALSTQEEFPRFSEFWLQPSADASPTLTIYALLDGPSLTGAYAFEARRADKVTMDVRAQLFTRSDIQRLGIAPLTSMYWYRSNELRRSVDWRPAIHDSDGLALWTGKGERIWRPLTDPPTLQTNSFMDTNPKGFGLSQRDRNFDDYQDDGAFYERRPSAWVEPIEHGSEGADSWGEGSVQLVEIPTDDEIHDNIVAYWQRRAPVASGSTLKFQYRLYWQSDDPPLPAGLARTVATRLGRGGVPGRPVPSDRWKFVVDFEGGELQRMKPRYDIEAVVSLSRGKVETPYVIKVVGTDRWRAFFDVALQGKDPVDLRCFLRLDQRTFTETWVYQFFPPA